MLFLSNSLHFPLYKSYEAWTLDPRFFEFRIRDFMLNKKYSMLYKTLICIKI